ncbi:MAG: hypothetical protein EON58_09890 [Alphaproteobacteria bacterium]|nr:MAG: hypothetical protein EON58_09890 [Alphaproteobacteria bacterium]
MEINRVGLLLGGVVAGANATEFLLGAPAIAASARMSVQACISSPVLCINRAGIITVDITAGDALGGASLAGGTLAAGKVVNSSL